MAFSKSLLKEKGSAIISLPKQKKYVFFSNPVESFELYNLHGIKPAIKKIEESAQKGKYIVMFLSYESAQAFDPAMTTIENNEFPKLWAGIYQSNTTFSPHTVSPPDILCLKAEISKQDYIKNIRKIKHKIYEGDTYQVNFTFRSRANSIENPENLFLYLLSAHPMPYSAYINTGSHIIVSISPELFLEKNKNMIISRPMKGTAPRSLSYTEDIAVARELSLSIKNRAENVMITDMVRNDLGKICVPGSVTTSELFKVETYLTLHQMVSEIRGILREKTSLFDILKATFPAASITGAPKIKTMEIIARHEKSPRKIYTGCIGTITPDGDFRFNVAIRTLLCSAESTELGIGSGIVADSDPAAEWNESVLKSDFLNYRMPNFDIIETILWERNRGLLYLDKHLQRARNSQNYFLRKWNSKKIEKCLANLSFPESANFARVRLRISPTGTPSSEILILEKKGWKKKKIKICVSNEKTRSDNIFLYHKTSNRSFYDKQFEQAHANGFDEILFMNEKNQLTEGAISNFFIRKKKLWITPKLACGLLPGIWRNIMIQKLDAEEKIIRKQDLLDADEIIVGNSVRGAASALIYT